MNLLENIKTVCADRGKTVTEVERAAGLSDNSIYRWDKTNPGVDKVVRVAEVLSVPIERLIR